jgi:hypothetical protein
MTGIFCGILWVATTAAVGDVTGGPLIALEVAAIPLRVLLAAMSLVLYARQRLPALPG